MSGASRLVPRLIAFAAAILLACAPAAGWAAVRITFYSKELGSSFPHAFVTLDGTLDRSGERIDANYGFSAKTISPAILFGAVAGEVLTDNSPAYIRGSDKHFALTLPDADYDKVVATVNRWRSRAQPSYDLGKHNCIHFVADIAASLGMRAETPKALMKKPRSYLNFLAAANGPWLAAHNAVFYRKGEPRR